MKRRAAWLKADTGGPIAREGRHFIARLGGTEIARRPDLGRLMDRLDYLSGPYGNVASVSLVPGPRYPDRQAPGISFPVGLPVFM